MQKTYGQYSSKGLSMHYSVYGEGKRVLIAFHGFGQDESAFDKLGEKLVQEFKIYSFDLPFHGKSSSTKSPLEKSDVKDFFDGFFREEAIERFSLLAFSIGARLAVTLVEQFPNRLESLLLLAPDGIGTHAVFRLATGTALSRNLFSFLTKNSHFLLPLVHFGTRLKMISPKEERMLKGQLNDATRRNRVVQTWLAFRKLELNPEVFASLLNEFAIPTFMVLAEGDGLVPHKNFSALRNGKSSFYEKTLNCPHHRLIDFTARLSDGFWEAFCNSSLSR